ncbi:uncharacterized protein LOC124882564 isoform X2 [Girardinichthys multiradiatus]|uniref:uncharacterized protein LOC124882564 isoform X2 n=1 Tax=Girardinichthys multiradiatus TaxID=208333 RepID=UPI001FABDAD1|nr:uncharacterized protein LOC124882564 isoform X2 [Girardinichthys multiradiatus]
MSLCKCNMNKIAYLSLQKMSKQNSKSHKAMDDNEWFSRLRSFASTGVWPSDAGNRPAPRQQKWYTLYQKIEKCPLLLRGQRTLFSQPQGCLCGFHLPKVPTASSRPTSSAAQSTSSQSSSIMLQTATPVKYPTGYSTPGTLAKRPKLTLSSFERSRFGGRHVENAKPNINVARKTHTNATRACTSTAAHSCADPVPAGGSLHNISPPQPQSAETFFLAPPLPAPKRQRPVEEQSSGNPFQPENTAVVQSPHLPGLQPASSAVVQSTVSSGLPGQTTSSEQVAVDEHSRAGMDRVDVLAEYLVELRKEKGLTLTNQQANTIVGLWHKLEQNDKDRILYAARHQERLLTGRFRSPKKKAVYAGVESTKRCVLGSSGSAAQWPDCSRLIEMIFIRLCNIHSSPKKIGHQTFSRWSQILNDYKNIRQLILNNGIIMKDTTLQLVTVNQTTLIQWHNKRFKAQDVAILMQGLVLPQERPIASEPLLPVNARPTQLTPHKHEHTYNLPPDTTGQAKTKLTIRDRAELKTIQPKPPASHPTVFYMPLHMPSTTAAGNNLPRLLLPPPTTPNIICPPYSKTPTGLTQTQETTQKEKRKYTRTVTSNRCTKCGEPRTTETGHSQYKGRIYCPNRETLTKEQWLRRMRK